MDPTPLVVTTPAPTGTILAALAAEAGTTAHAVSALGLPEWLAAPLVLIADDPARPWPLPRRPDVILVATDLDDATVWDRAIHLGADKVAFLPDARDWLLHRLAGLVDPPAV